MKIKFNSDILTRMAARILKLTLSRPLVFSSREGVAMDDTIEVFDSEDAIRFDDDGPHAASPLPPPFFKGRAMQGIEETDLSGLSTDGAAFAIGSKVHALAQFHGGEDASSCLDSFIRDAWWAGIVLRGYLALRRLREDGKDSIQWIAPAAFPPSREP
jgi:hypothetical protein